MSVPDPKSKLADPISTITFSRPGTDLSADLTLLTQLPHDMPEILIVVAIYVPPMLSLCYSYAILVLHASTPMGYAFIVSIWLDCVK